MKGVIQPWITFELPVAPLGTATARQVLGPCPSKAKRRVLVHDEAIANLAVVAYVGGNSDLMTTARMSVTNGFLELVLKPAEELWVIAIGAAGTAFVDFRVEVLDDDGG